MKKSQKLGNEKVLEDFFLESAPKKYNRKALVALLAQTIDGNGNLLSRLNDFKKKKSKLEKDWLSLFAEIHVKYMLTEEIKKYGGKISFSQRDKNDLFFQINEKGIYIEVKSIMPSDFQLDYDDFLREIINIPTGKAVSIRIKGRNDRDAIYKKIKNRLKNLNGNYLDDDFEIKIIKDIGDKNKSVFIGPAFSFWVNEEGLTKLIKTKLSNKPKQIQKADVICFYSFHNMFDSEDFLRAIKAAVEEINGLSNKKFLCFTMWNNGQLIFVRRQNTEWKMQNISDFCGIFAKS